jgi:hypothetical protein
MDTVGELTTLYRFAGYQGGDEGSGPTDRLIQATDGLLYGTTLNTKAFKVDEAGNLT